MKPNEYNDLLVIIENLPENERKLVPERFIDFVRASAVEGAVSDIRSDIPLNQQNLSEGTRNLLASLYVTYLVGDSEKRYFFVNNLHQKSSGEKYISSEQYQAFLADYDKWNELFGLIPYWSASRHWHPEFCYEVVEDEKGSDIKAGNTYLKHRDISEQQRQQILEEARKWVLLEHVEEEETLYWHNDDHDTWNYVNEKKDFYNKNVIIKDFHFHGALLRTSKRTGMGLAQYNDDDYGILLIDGSHDGCIEDYESRSSDESSYSKKSVYSLKRKES